MATLPSPSSASSILLLLLISLTLLLSTTPAHSVTCDQKFKNNKIYANCTSLPSLSSILHYTYNATNSSLSVAFVAAPASPDGWVAWGVNPNATGMAGTQALVALKSSAGALVLKTFNLVSYSTITEEKLSIDVWDLAVESHKGATAIFASVKIPAGADSVNHIWQVGAKVANGVPVKHEFGKDNLAAKETLQLTGAAAPAPGSAPASAPGPGSENGTSGGYRGRMGVGSVGLVVAVLAGLF